MSGEVIRSSSPPPRQVQHDSEHALFQATMQWLSQTPERTAHARQLLSHIRFPLMPLVDLVGQVLPAVQALLPVDAGCESLVEEALEYHASVSAQPLLQTGRTMLRGGVEQLLLIGGEVQIDDRSLSLSELLKIYTHDSSLGFQLILYVLDY